MSGRCEWCGKPTKGQARYCSDQCRTRAWRARRKAEGVYPVRPRPCIRCGRPTVAASGLCRDCRAGPHGLDSEEALVRYLRRGGSVEGGYALYVLIRRPKRSWDEILKMARGEEE